jgi:hypothetical protein
MQSKVRRYVLDKLAGLNPEPYKEPPKEPSKKFKKRYKLKKQIVDEYFEIKNAKKKAKKAKKAKGETMPTGTVVTFKKGEKWECLKCKRMFDLIFVHDKPQEEVYNNLLDLHKKVCIDCTAPSGFELLKTFMKQEETK